MRTIRAVIATSLLSTSISTLSFDSYIRPIQEILSDSNLRAQMRENLRARQYEKVYGGHYFITKECLSDAKLTDDMIDQLSRKVSDIDYDNWFTNRKHYEAKNHCDRPVGASHESAFAGCLAYHREYFTEAWWALRTGNIESFVKAFPRALHTQQDFFSHSNVTDDTLYQQLPEIQACWSTYLPYDATKSDRDNEQIFWNDRRCIVPASDWVANLRITGYDPLAPTPYSPANDKYSHEEKSKDNPDRGGEGAAISPTGNTKYQAARRAAVDTCSATVEAFRLLCASDQACTRFVPKLFK